MQVGVLVSATENPVGRETAMPLLRTYKMERLDPGALE
jgi:hypothetical protein